MRPGIRRIAAVHLLLWSVVVKSEGQTPTFPEIEGWKLSVDETVYKPDSLWDVIDGAADLFLEYNFVDLRIGRYHNAGELEIKVELYTHGSPIDAFGMYSQERYPDYQFIDLGVQGYIEKGVLNFLSGPYYVKLSTVQSGKEAQDALSVVGKEVADHLRQPKTWPELFHAFPSHGRKPNSEQYIARNFLGYSFLNGVYVAGYDDGNPFTAFVIRADSPDQGVKAVEEYAKILPKDGVTKVAEGKFRVRDPHNGVVELIQKGRDIFGVYAFEGEKDHELFLTELGRALSSIK